MTGMMTQRETDVWLREGESPDDLGISGLKVIRGLTGFRHSMDALLLAQWAAPRSTDRVLDLGCGNGAITFLLAHRHPDLRITGLEVQPALADRARRGAQLNGLRNRIEIVEGDLRRITGLLPAARFDMVLCNPPYREIASGRLSPDPEIRQAKHELTATLQEAVAAIRYVLAPKGRACLIYHASRLADLLSGLRVMRLEPKMLRLVHSYPGAKAELSLVEARRDGRPGLQILSPLFVYQAHGGPLSPGMEAIYHSLATSDVRRTVA
ncbi:MAG: methyltransferase domain-containing protein [candidate division NC10 bacterium]|nr:methyltransferase domain-containing protein [candidate division NC10 bacterium]MDE2322287.1 methyltransferase domain-containing protein [candidate division NC10 bacterium]